MVAQEITVYRHDFELLESAGSHDSSLCGYSLWSERGTAPLKANVSSPWHGRSIHWMDHGGIHVLKGSGVPYLPQPYRDTGELPGYVWGGLRGDDALREWNILKEAQFWGIRCPEPGAVFRYAFTVPPIPGNSFEYHGWLYRVESPYRLVDLEFLGQDGARQLAKAIRNTGWEEEGLHLGLAHWLGATLGAVRKAGWFHNAVTTHNITLALELLDFEAAHRLDDASVDPDMRDALLAREQVHAMEVLYYVSFWLGEHFDVQAAGAVLDEYLGR